jgi:hypothetical protein
MLVEVVFDLARENVLAAADHHVLAAADDLAVTVGIERREVAAVHPAGAIDRLAGALRIVPVTFHHRIAACQQLAGDATRDDAAMLVDDLDFDVRLNAPDGGDALFDRVVRRALERHRRGFGHAIHDRYLAHVHALHDLIHHADRAGSAAHCARAQARKVVASELAMLERRDEHRRHAMHCRAPLGLDGFEE